MHSNLLSLIPTLHLPPVHMSQVFVLDGAVLPKSSAQQLLTLRHIDPKECTHRIGE